MTAPGETVFLNIVLFFLYSFCLGLSVCLLSVVELFFCVRFHFKDVCVCVEGGRGGGLEKYRL